MKTFIISTFCLLISVFISYAQETMEVRSKLTKKVTAIYHVLASDKQVKQGLYQVVHAKNMALASGLYTNNKRTGIWHFFDYKGNLNENFNYDNNTLMYEAQGDLNDGFKYLFDKKFTSTDVITKPMKIGGRCFGYIALLNLFKKPESVHFNSYSSVTYVMLELLVSQAGNLADYTIHLDDRDLNLNLNLLDQEDKTFIPATINGDPVAARITIECYIDLSGNLKLINQQ